MAREDNTQWDQRSPYLGIVLYDDQPVTHRNDDLLAFGDLVNLVVRTIQYSGPMMLAVTGGWGTGKTSFCRQLIRHTKELREGNAGSTSSARGEPRIWPHNVVASTTTDPEWTVLSGIVLAVNNNDREEAREIVAQFVRDHPASQNGPDIDLGAFATWLRRRLPQEDRALLVIDDLDRCDDDEIRAYFKALRKYLDLERLCVLLAVDERRLASAPPEVSADKTPGGPPSPRAARALEKYVRQQFPLPRLEPERLTHDHRDEEDRNSVSRMRVMANMAAPGERFPRFPPEDSRSRRGWAASLLDFSLDGVWLLFDRPARKIRCLDDLLLAAANGGIPLRTFKRIINDLLVNLAEKAYELGAESWEETLYTWQGEGRWFPDNDVDLFGITTGRPAGKRDLLWWKRTLMECLVTCTLCRTWPVLHRLVDERPVPQSFRQIMASMAAMGQGDGVFDHQARIEGVATQVGCTPDELPDRDTLMGLCRLMAFMEQLCGPRAGAGTGGGAVRGDADDQDPGQPKEIVQKPYGKEPLESEEPDGPQPKDHRLLRQPPGLTAEGARVWHTVKKALDNPSQVNTRTALALLAAADSTLPSADLERLFDVFFALFYQYRDHREVAISAGNIAVELENRGLERKAYQIYQVQRRYIEDRTEHDPEEGFLFASQYISFLQDANEIDAELRNDPVVAGAGVASAKEEAARWLARYEEHWHTFKPELRLRYLRLRTIQDRSVDGFEKLLKASMEASGGELTEDAAMSVMQVMDSTSHVDRRILKQILEAKEGDERVMRGAADLLADASSREEGRAAVWLYREIARMEGPLWNAATKHNLATLLASHNKHRGIAFRLWSEALAERPGDESVRRGFASFLAREQEASAAFMVLEAGELPDEPLSLASDPSDLDALDHDPEYAEMGLDNPFWEQAKDAETEEPKQDSDLAVRLRDPSDRFEAPRLGLDGETIVAPLLDAQDSSGDLRETEPPPGNDSTKESDEE